jgi:hypothetical protein
MPQPHGSRASVVVVVPVHCWNPLPSSPLLPPFPGRVSLVDGAVGQPPAGLHLHLHLHRREGKGSEGALWRAFCLAHKGAHETVEGGSGSGGGSGCSWDPLAQESFPFRHRSRVVPRTSSVVLYVGKEGKVLVVLSGGSDRSSST